jgi:hypothetical protein
MSRPSLTPSCWSEKHRGKDFYKPLVASHALVSAMMTGVCFQTLQTSRIVDMVLEICL